ncbi:uncharacterized protein [Dermacentor andersoni]|uniref:uncharacterized protein n=1 Tax=Dermacentor andersoni TaxID=34620 RepID=UPI002417C178|nr:uncharacterized protein LOC129383953 [Dermacentor andersoni]
MAACDQDLTGTESLRWLDACTCSLLHCIAPVLTPIFLLLVLVLLCTPLQSSWLGKDGPSEETRMPPAPPRRLAGPICVEEDPWLTQAIRDCRSLLRNQQDMKHRITRLLAEANLRTEPFATREIQHRVRTNVQPRVLGRVVYSTSPSHPRSEPDRRDRDAGATSANIVDHDGTSTVGLQQPGDASLVETHLDQHRHRTKLMGAYRKRHRRCSKRLRPLSEVTSSDRQWLLDSR